MRHVSFAIIEGLENSELDFVQYRPRPENFVCGDFFPSLFKGKYDPSEIPTISLLIVIPDEGVEKRGSRCSMNSGSLMFRIHFFSLTIPYSISPKAPWTLEISSFESVD